MTDSLTLQEPLVPPEPERPAERRLTPREWVKENLFSGAFNTILTVLFGILLLVGGFRVTRYLFITARWDIVRDNLTNFMVGFFPRDQLWRPWAALFLFGFAIGVHWGAVALRAANLGTRERPTWRTAATRTWPLALLFVVFMIFSGSLTSIVLMLGLAAVVLAGRSIGKHLPAWLAHRTTIMLAVAVIAAFEIVAGFGGVGIARWRGLLLTMFLAIAGIVLSFPFGVLLALGRRSSFPAIRLISVGYIELIRGVPLITLLFMAFLILGFFLPAGATTPSLVSRVLVALVLFTAAYLAEIVRGGLQSVPKGQIEAAQALGLKPVAITARIVLPQALRNVIPAIVGQFISLFKDTSLVGFVGLTELLGVAQQVTKQPSFVGKGLQAETLAFAAFVYWVGAFWMSRTSQRLEKRLGVGER